MRRLTSPSIRDSSIVDRGSITSIHESQFTIHSNLKRAGFTLHEILIAVLVLAVLAGLALPIYWRTVRRSENAEALVNMEAIRKAELAHRHAHPAYANADSTGRINELFGLGIQEHLFRYKIVDATDSDFRIIAERLGPLGDETLDVLAMSVDGQTLPIPATPPGAVAIPPTPDVGRGGGGLETGGISVGGGGGSISGGGGGGGGGGPGGPAGGGAGGIQFLGGSGGISFGTPRPFEYIPRGDDVWSAWPDDDLVNITGTGAASLTAAFNLIAASETFDAITDDLFDRGISITFGAAADFDAGGICAGAIACFGPSGLDGQVPPDTPDPVPFIIFNPDYITESAGLLAVVLVHEGTHFQQFLDFSLFDNTQSVIDTEFEAFWNEAVYWDGVRADFLPFDTDLEEESEFIYQTALQGEAALRTLIDSLY